MYEHTSLWNITNKKHSIVINYIRSLQIKDFWGSKARAYFHKVIKDSLNAKTSNEALEIIGYRYKKEPMLMVDCQRRNV